MAIGWAGNKDSGHPAIMSIFTYDILTLSFYYLEPSVNQKLT